MRLRDAFLVLVAGLASCGREAAQVVRRPGEPDIVRIAGDEEGMNAAIRQAASTLPEFKTVLAAPPENAQGFNVKVEFTTITGEVEHIWLSSPSFTNGEVSGRVNNEPADVPAIELGQLVSAPEARVSDWMYVQDGVLRGGFTIRALLDRMPPADRDRTIQSMGFRLE